MDCRVEQRKPFLEVKERAESQGEGNWDQVAIEITCIKYCTVYQASVFNIEIIELCSVEMATSERYQSR